MGKPLRKPDAMPHSVTLNLKYRDKGNDSLWESAAAVVGDGGHTAVGLPRGGRVSC